MVGRTLFLRWNDHHATFMHMLPEIRRKEQYCDATIWCEGHFYGVHRFVLATCSSYFEQMFSKLECKHPMIVLADIKAIQLEALLIYMYVGELQVLQKSLPDILRAATSLKVRGLSEESDHEVDMEMNAEAMTHPNFNVSHIEESCQIDVIPKSGQHGKECRKRLMDNDNQGKAVKQRRQPDSSGELISSSFTNENGFKVADKCGDTMQQPSNFSFLSMSEPVIPCRIQTVFPGTVSIAENENHHEALMLWKDELDFSAENDTAPRQNCNINTAESPSVENMMVEEIEVKTELVEIMPEVNCVYDDGCLESTYICTDQPDCSISVGTTNNDNEVPNLNAPSTSSFNKYHNRVTLSNDTIKYSCVDLYYPVESSDCAYSKVHENNAELDNIVQTKSPQGKDEGKDGDEFHFHTGYTDSRVNGVLYRELEPASSLARQKEEKRDQTTLPCTNRPDDPVPVKRGRGRPRKEKVDHTKMHNSKEGSGTSFEMQDNNLGSKIAQNDNAEPQNNHSHDSHSVKKASQPKVHSRKKKRGPRPILKGYISKWKRRNTFKSRESNKQKNASEVCRIKSHPEDTQITMQNTGILRTTRRTSQIEDISEEARISSRPHSKKKRTFVASRV